MKSVLQDWVMKLPLREQGTLLTVVRGCDRCIKSDQVSRRVDSVARFWLKFDENPDTGCWLWTAGVSASGYAMLSGSGTTSKQAHRFAYELLVGPIPDGLDLDHLCRVRRCVNPGHVEPVTRAENIRRGARADVLRGVRTTCLHGHALDGRRGNGDPYCLTCNRDRAARNRALRRVA